MRKLILLPAFILFGYLNYAQVGINNTNPQASLDITASNPSTPASTDGILIPRVDAFPNTNPGANQQGMMVYLTTTSGSNQPGFYYWDNNTSLWKPIAGNHNTLEQAYNEGGSGNGRIVNITNGNILLDGDGKGLQINSSNLTTNYDSSLRINATLNGAGNSSLFMSVSGNGFSSTSSHAIKNYINYSNMVGNEMHGLSNIFVVGTIGGSFNLIYKGYRGVVNDFYSVNNTSGSNIGIQNKFSSGAYRQVGLENNFRSNANHAYGLWNHQEFSPDTEFRGVFNNFTGTSASGRSKYGVYTTLGGGGNGYKFGSYIDISSTAGGTHYGVYADVQKATGYAGYFIGRMSLGNSTTNRYLMPAIDGSANQVMATDGLGQVSFVDASTVFTDTDDQTIDTFSFNSATNTLTLEIENDGIAAQTVDLSTLSNNANNGLNIDAGTIQLGGNLVENTTINFGGFNTSFNLDSTGDFIVQDNGVTSFIVEDTGDVGFGLSSPAYQVDISETDNTKLRAVNISKTDNTSSISYGVYNSKTSSGSSIDYAQYNELSGSGSGTQYAIANQINTTGTGLKYGVVNTFSVNSPSSKIGFINNFLNNTGDNHGLVNVFANANNASFGVQNQLTGDGVAAKTGIRNQFGGANGDVNPYIGFDNSFNDSGDGIRYGLRNTMSGTGNGAQYGNYNSLSGTGTGNKYGSYNLISSSAGGTHYGVYSSAGLNNGWAGYFVGKNYISGRLSIGETNNTNANLSIRTNSTSTVSHIELKETSANDGARIRFTNTSETSNRWTIFGRADNTAADSRFNIFHNGTGNIIVATGNGNVGIRRTPTTNTLEVNGNASKNTAGSWLANSDKRLKKDITNIKGSFALNKINKMQGVTYKWDDDKTGIERPSTIQYGFIAQDIMKVFPSKVSKDNLGYYQTAYGDYDPIFVEAIKELNKKINRLEQENKQLKELLQNQKLLEQRIQKLENFIKN